MLRVDPENLRADAQAPSLRLGVPEHRSGKVQSGPLLCVEGRFTSQGTVPSHPNKSLGWTLDLPSVLK